LVAAACGEDNEGSMTGSSTPIAGKADRSIDIRMVDNAYEPKSLTVKAGETVRFIFANVSEVDHDAFIGDTAAQADHEDEMRAADESSDDRSMGSRDEGNGITLGSGEGADLTYTFAEPGTVEIGCHEPGHYDSGMKVAVTVS